MVERRHFLRLCGFAGVGTLAGCASNSGDDSTPIPTTTPTRTSEDWTQQAKFTADDAHFGDRFGFSVAVSGDGTTALVAAVGEGGPDHRGTETTEHPDGGNTSMTETPSGGGMGENRDGRKEGAVYVFDTSGGSWSQQAKLTVDDGNSEDVFGWSVALSDDGTTAVIGSHHEANPDPKSGSAYVFDASGGSWSQQAKLVADDGDRGNEFGNSVAISGDATTALVAAVEEEDSNGEDAGSAYVFDASGGSWSQQAKLIADDGDSEDGFGFSVAVSDDGTSALISAIWDEDPNGDRAGSAYVFDASGGSWSQQVKLATGGGGMKNRFGVSVALSGDGTTALISAPETYRMDSGGQGSAYVFGASGESWSQQATLPLDDGEGDRFGRSVALSGDGTTSLIGDPQNFMNGGMPTGAAYVFTP